ncbi:MAG: cellulase family glycosylhydrolase, partial [Chitinophagaceae bacterium]
MKQSITAFAFLIFCFATRAQSVKDNGSLKVSGTQLVNEKNNPVVLHGMSFGWHNLWPRFYNKGAVHELVKKWKCSVIRASMGIELNASGYLKSPESSVKLMKKVINAGIKEGV